MKNITIDGVEYTPVINTKIIDLITVNQTISIQVYPTDLGDMSWDDAVKACSDLGDGWRLPSRIELLLMYENKEIIGGFADNNYWSSTEISYNYAWLQNFNNGKQFNYYKNFKYNVRAVKLHKS